MLPARFWRVVDYVDHRGINVVKTALDTYPIAARIAINAFIQNIEVVRPPFDPRDVKKLKNKYGQNCLGFVEFRVRSGGVQYRPIVWHGPGDRDLAIFAVAVEQNNRLHPFGVCDTCVTRRGRLNRHEGHIVQHDFS
jgi:hypothetical protein